MSFRLVSKSVTFNDLERRNGPYLRYFNEFVYDVIFTKLTFMKRILRLVNCYINY